MSAARTRGLPDQLARLLRAGVDQGQRSQAVRSVMLGMVNAGWTFGEFVDSMNDSGNRLAGFFAVDRRGRTRTNAARDRLLVDEWRRAVKWVDDNPAVQGGNDARQQIALLQAELRACPLRPNDQHVMRGILEIGLACGRINPTISQRQLAEHVGLPRTTVSDVLARLHEDRRVRIEPAERRRAAPTVVILHTSRAHRSGDDRVEDPSGETPSFAVSNLWCAWGQATRAAYLALDCEPRRPSAIADRANIHVRTAQRACKRLADTGLATATGGEYRLGSAEVDAVARDYSVRDVLSERRRQHQLDRGQRPGVAA